MSTPYRPELRTEVWADVKDFVLAAVKDATSKTPYSTKDLLLTCSRLAAWADREAGLPLERQLLFRREVIADFIATGCPSSTEAARANMRSQLLRMSEALLHISQVPRRLKPLSAAPPSRPYTLHETISLRSWANGQSTQGRRSNARVLVAAGLGAGLSATEIGELRIADIEVDALGVRLWVRQPRQRMVPVIEEWASYLAGRKSELPDDAFAFRENHKAFYPNLVSNFVARSGTVGVKPQTQRMRATWIVRHLTAGTPVHLLVRAAGVDSLEALTRYMQFVPEVADDAARLILTLPRLRDTAYLPAAGGVRKVSEPGGPSRS